MRRSPRSRSTISCSTTQFFFKVDHILNQLGSPALPPLSGLPSANGFSGFVLSKSQHFALAALPPVPQDNVLSSAQVMVLDNQTARLQVGQQVPILTGTAQS